MFHMTFPEALDDEPITPEQAALVYGQALQLLHMAREGMEFVDWKIDGVDINYLKLIHRCESHTATLMKIVPGEVLFLEEVTQPAANRPTRDSFQVSTEYILKREAAELTTYRVPLPHQGNKSFHIEHEGGEVLQPQAAMNQTQYRVLHEGFNNQFEVGVDLRPRRFLGRLSMFNHSRRTA